MTGRRRHQRFAVTSLVTGLLDVLEDAAMESGDGTQFVITTRTAPVVGDEATLHFKGAEGTRSIRVRVVESQLHMVKDGVRHRVRSDVPRRGAGAGCRGTGEVAMSEQPGSREQITLIVFQQQLPVRLVNISRSGCLLQAPRAVRVGTVGRLRVALDDTEYADDVRVARCDTAKGAACSSASNCCGCPSRKSRRTVRRRWR